VHGNRAKSLCLCVQGEIVLNIASEVCSTSRVVREEIYFVKKQAGPVSERAYEDILVTSGSGSPLENLYLSFVHAHLPQIIR